MNPFESGFADNEEADSHRTRHAVPRVIASLIVAFFAYLGMAIGGGFGSVVSTETSSFSSGKSTQPLYLSLRDTTRGIVAAERDAAPKGSWHDGAPALLPAPPTLSLLNPPASASDPADAALAAFLLPSAYLARAPPSFAG